MTFEDHKHQVFKHKWMFDTVSGNAVQSLVVSSIYRETILLDIPFSTKTNMFKYSSWLIYSNHSLHHCTHLVISWIYDSDILDILDEWNWIRSCAIHCRFLYSCQSTAGWHMEKSSPRQRGLYSPRWSTQVSNANHRLVFILKIRVVICI